MVAFVVLTKPLRENDNDNDIEVRVNVSQIVWFHANPDGGVKVCFALGTTEDFKESADNLETVIRRWGTSKTVPGDTGGE